jgi:hypothetical protein
MSDLPHLAMSKNWYAWEIEVFRRAKGNCEYCDKYLMASSDSFYYDRHFDHIRPDEGNGVENMAVACKTCNFIKRDQKFAGSSRVEIIANARAYIRSVRERNDRRLAVDKAWFESGEQGGRVDTT